VEIVAGFLIAIGIGLTGVGAGIITAPVLMTFFHVPPAAAVGTALLFGSVTKMVIVPVYAMRRQIHIPTLSRMLAGGLPGVVLGSFILTRLDATQHQATISLVLGATIIIFAALSLVRLLHPRASAPVVERPWLLGALCFPIGAEVGFSSAGSGSLASLAIMALTRLETATIVGTDVSFGLGLGLVGGGVLFSGGHDDMTVLPKLVAGGVAGAILAPNLAAHIPTRPLRIGLLAWIVFLGTQLVIKGLGH
jgi:uncharacterized membrane protein YfcA